MLTDTRILTRHAGHDVLREQRAVPFGDGSHIHLHPVHVHGVPDTWARARQLADGLHWVVVDLRALLPRSFEIDMKQAPARDHDGLVLYALRAAFPSADAFDAAATRHHRTAWTQVDDTPPVAQPGLQRGAFQLL